MINKEDYIRLKRDIRCMCYTNIVKLCDNMNLNNEERTLLLKYYNGDTRTKICYDMNISAKYYTTHIKVLFSKINDYLKTYSKN